MCRVLGISAFDWSRHRPMVERFCQLVRTGVVMAGDPPGHEDGWGLALYRHGELVVEKSGLNLLEETDRVFALLEQTAQSPVLILHLRKSAWKNTSNTRHAHPFHDGNTVFFHNGVVYDYERLLPAITHPGLEPDARDTEVFFYHILSQAGGDLGARFLASAAVIRQSHDFSAMNALLSDGKKLYAYREYGREPDYYSLYRAVSDNSWYISSEPLDDDLRWEMMAQGEFLAIDL
ncbi:MAG: class II glutamine amidotransferase [Desulfuromonas sp.]|nr:MAG: class II glutamine amidotransferase [Desulfuromonas sp.]